MKLNKTKHAAIFTLGVFLVLVLFFAYKKNLIMGQKIPSPPKLSLSKNYFELARNSGDTLAAEITNAKNSVLSYWISIGPISVPEGASEEDAFDWFTGSMGRTLKPQESIVEKFRLMVPSNAKSGVYIFEFRIIDNGLNHPDNLYESRKISVEVE